MKRAIIYTRFSPRRNADKCESCESQQAFCEQHAAKKGYELGPQFHDPDVSGKDEYREKLWQAIETLRKGDVLLVYKRDRLARNVYLSEQIGRAVETRGGRIEAVAGDVEGDGHEQVLVRQMLASIAEYERKLIGQRTSHAMKQHQRQGRRMSRHAPYGWQIDPADPKRMVRVSLEQSMITRIKTLRGEGKSLGEIVKVMDPLAARTGHWNVKLVWKILKREGVAA